MVKTAQMNGIFNRKIPPILEVEKVNDNFEQLKAHVGSVHELTSNAAKGVINQMLTVRNLFFHL